MDRIKQEQTLSDNELIAEFMVYERSKECWEKGEHAYTMKLSEVFNKWVIPSKMKFDTSWDWLMPVVEKIHGMQDKLLDGGFVGIDPIRNFFTLYITAPLPKVYKAVVEIIKFINENL